MIERSPWEHEFHLSMKVVAFAVLVAGAIYLLAQIGANS
jgi:hypothetical protein